MLSSNYFLYSVLQCPFFPKIFSFYGRTAYCFNLSDLLDPDHSTRGCILRNFKVIQVFLMMRLLNNTCLNIQLVF